MTYKNKDIVIIGGAGPAAGIVLTKQIIKICQEKYHCQRDRDFPYVSLLSFPFEEMLKTHDKKKVADQLNALIQQECTHTKLWVIACNTLHCYLDDIKIPNTFVHLMEECKKVLHQKPIVLCSSTSKYYQVHRKYFACDYPHDEMQPRLDQLIDELMAHEPTNAIYAKFKSILDTFPGRQIFLGCTEFSLLSPFFEDTNHIVDPLRIIAETLCSLHFGN